MNPYKRIKFKDLILFKNCITDQTHPSIEYPLQSLLRS